MTKSHDKDIATQADPFRPQGDVDDNACINNWMEFSQLAECYKCSADALVACALEDHNLLDLHAYAVCFLYRHGLELILKDMVWKSHYLLTGTKRFMLPNLKELGRHCLSDLWKKGRVDSESVLGDDLPFDAVADEQVRQLLLQFERHDPNSSSFRYPIGKKTGRTHPDVNNVNLRVLRDRVHQAVDRVEMLVSLIDWCYERQSEMDCS